MSSRFDPEFYSLYRPFYPAETFAGLGEELRLIADIGCGTGHSTVSLIKAGIKAQVIGIDPDQRMLEAAHVIAKDYPGITWKQGSGESTGLESQSLDAILVGSAFHWMDPLKTKAEFLRILKPGGLIRIFEYQFPKAPSLPQLNEWIRREFNLRWKAPHQKPRGSLKELTSVFREDPAFRWLGESQAPMQLALNAEELTGLILSQSRVLHYEDTLTGDERLSFRTQLGHDMKKALGDESHLFDFKLSWVNLARRQ